MQHHQRSCVATIHGNSGIFLATLPYPSARRRRWTTFNGVICINLYTSVLFGCHLADEDVIVASRHVVVGNKALVTEKQPLTVGEILAYAHVRLACQSGGEVHRAVL